MFFFFQAEDGIRDVAVTGVQTCALPIFNKQTVPYVVFSGKCPHLGCGYKWRSHKTRGQVFLCPCHLSIYDAAGIVLDGPAPRPLDVIPSKVSPTGDIEGIDVEYKAGQKELVRIALTNGVSPTV